MIANLHSWIENQLQQFSSSFIWLLSETDKWVSTQIDKLKDWVETQISSLQNLIQVNTQQIFSVMNYQDQQTLKLVENMISQLEIAKPEDVSKAIGDFFAGLPDQVFQIFMNWVEDFNRGFERELTG
jgi:uncharacterized protein YgfB (UPF0149 family)